MKKFLVALLTVVSAVFFYGLIPGDPTAVSASGGNQTAVDVSVVLTACFDAENTVETAVSSVRYGDRVSLSSDLGEAPSGSVTYQFLFWEVNGSLTDFPLDHEFVLTGTNEITAVFSPSDGHAVAFVDANRKVLKLQYVEDGASATPPASLPDRPGMTVSGWSASYENVTSDVVAVLQYSNSVSGTFEVTVAGGTGDGFYGYNEVATLAAESAPSGQYFHHWECDGKVIGYGTPFSLTVFAAMDIVAVYADSAPADLPRIILGDDLELRSGESRRTYLARYYLPEGYSLVECGLLSHAEALAGLTLDTEGAVRRTSKIQNPSTGEFLMSIPSGSSQTVRAFLIAKDPSGDLVTVYDESAYEIENGGFETGDLSGWTAYGIWKDESSLTAFREERVVSTEYYGSSGTNFYNRDGNYHFGVYADPYDNSNKDLNQERMGMLRSTDFVLSGSGWISFKLGGGKNDSEAYLSVHDAETGEEIARYSNRNFGLTSVSGTANAEAYLFPYYADLSAFLGRSLYILLVDAASHQWNVLACDSVDTYLPLTPETDSDTLAENIVPVIAGAGSAANSIPNGTLTSNLSGWENPDGIFQIGNGGAVSSLGGNSAVGCLRSPAFKIGTNHILRFDFAGGIQHDKQVFVLVKEVGTNLEVLRLVRREDQASRTDSGDFKTHWYDLSGLDPDKEYYLEVVDNLDGDWGVALIKDVSLVSSALSDYQVAVNADYGLALVSSKDGTHPMPSDSLVSLPDPEVWFVSATPGEDASTEMGIHYQTDSVFTSVLYTTASDPYFRNAVSVSVTGTAYSSAVSTSEGITYGFSSRYLGEADLSGLVPDTEYLYRIVNGNRVTSTGTFTTGPGDGTFSFLYLSDTQAETYAEAGITADLLEAAEAYGPYAFTLLTGDIVEVGNVSLYWDRFFATKIASTPILSIPGNHDYQDSSRTIVTPEFYASLFDNPKNGISTRQDTSYWVVYGNALFVMLDAVTDGDLAAQQAWFAEVVADHRQDFVVVCMHYSLYGTYHDGDAATVTEDWLSVFDAAEVDLVLSGHDHIYARTPAMTGGVATGDPESGTVYFIGGTGGHKFREVDSGTNFAFYIAPTETTGSRITVGSTEITVTSFDVDGNVVDAFTVPKKTS